LKSARTFYALFFLLSIALLPIWAQTNSAADAKNHQGGQADEKTIPVIARDAGKAIVLVVASDCPDSKVVQGSGFIVNSDGTVVTNFHVIDGCSSAIVKFTDGAFYQIAGILAADPTKDIAILKIDGSRMDFPFLVIADSDQAEVGEHVVAIGSPLALLELAGNSDISTEATVSDGIISGKRDWEGHGITVLQTTAPISHGSSGGALLDLRGQVLGITTMMIGDAQNINFVVPAKYVTSMLSAETLKPLGQARFANKEQADHPDSLDQFAGTYVGMWQSRFGSGLAVLNVTMDHGSLVGRVAITGSPAGYEGDSLAVIVKDFGDGVLNVEMKAENSPLTASGIFRNGTFVGDYRFKYRRGIDKGQWALKK
jgi:Trypsin-like peptidase domain